MRMCLCSAARLSTLRTSSRTVVTSSKMVSLTSVKVFSNPAIEGLNFMAKNNNGSSNGSQKSETQRDATPCRPGGDLVVIGGNEKKEGARPILELLAKRVGSGKLIVVTLASEEPEEQWQEYQKSFRELGVE